MKLKFTNCRIVTPSSILDGSVIIDDGKIDSLFDEKKQGGEWQDLKGAYILPGLVDIHGDDIEHEIFPRRGPSMPADLAIHQADLKMVANGITTKLHAIGFYDSESKNRSVRVSRMIVDSLKENGRKGVVSARHHVHFRCELTSENSVSILQDMAGDPIIRLVSLMVHAPGIRQFKQGQKFQETYKDLLGLNDSELLETIQLKNENLPKAEERLRTAVRLAKENKIPLASHDDDSPEKVEELSRLGVGISEFPITLAAAQKAKELGMYVCMGAPNLVRGSSHSGNLDVKDALETGVVDILCSDYHAPSMLYSVFMNFSEEKICEAARRVSLSPALSVGMSEIGSIEEGKIADLAVVRLYGSVPVVVSTLVGGKKVFSWETR